MDLRQLECFMAVAEELHFGRAAAKLYMSQSTVSEAVRALEHVVGAQLFDRTSRRVRLTELGETFRTEAGPSISRLKKAILDCKELAAGRKRSLKVGFLGGGFYELYRPLVSEFQELHETVALEFIELSYVNQFSAVIDGTVDTAFCRLPLGHDGLSHGPIIMRDQRMLCVPKDHPLAMEVLVKPESLAGEKILRMAPNSVNQEWQDYHFPRLTPQGKPIGAGPVIRTVREGIEAVAARQGIFILARRAASYYASPQVTFVQIDFPAMSSALVWRINDERPLIVDLNALLVRIARRHGTLPHESQ